MKSKIINGMRRLSDIYRQDGKAFKYHLASVGLSTLAGAVTAGCLENYTSCGPALNSTLTTGVATGSYWTPFIGLLARSERNEMKDENGKYDSKKVASKAAQYASFVGLGEFLYSGMRGVIQYQIQKRTELDAAYASALTDIVCATAYGVLVPPIRQALRKLGREKTIGNLHP